MTRVGPGIFLRVEVFGCVEAAGQFSRQARPGRAGYKDLSTVFWPLESTYVSQSVHQRTIGSGKRQVSLR